MSTQSIQVSETIHHACGAPQDCNLRAPCYSLSTYRITGDLANRIRARFRASTIASVILTEKVHNTGWEYTVTSTWLEFSVTCAGRTVAFPGGDDGSGGQGTRLDSGADEPAQGIAALLEWLGDTPTPPA